MEFEVLSEEVEWEARRVAAAFGVKQWNNEEEEKHDASCWKFWGESFVGPCIEWGINHKGFFYSIFIDEVPTLYWTGIDSSRTVSPTWLYWPDREYDEIMARGLYQLGFEDEEALGELNYPLTAHEKLELRLSLPREFWPQKWLDEEDAGQTETL